MKFFILFLNKTALHLAVERNNLDIVRLLLQNPQINVNIKTILSSIFNYI